MNEVGGSESGTGLRAIKSSRSSDANFEYDDSEWDVGIGNLIIDLDADIEKNNEANRNNNNSSSGTTGPISATSGGGSSSSTGNTSNLSVTSPGGGGGSSNPQMHIPLTSSSGSNSGNSKSAKSSPSPSSSGNTSKGSNSTDATVMEHSSIVDKGLKMKIKRTKTGTKSDAKHEIVKNDVVGSSSSNGTGSSSSGSNSSGYSNNKNSSISDSLPTKNSHTSHKDKDKLLIKDAHLHDNSHEAGGGGNSGSINSKVQDSPSTDHSTTAGGKVKTPRKGSTKEKKVKPSNVGNSGNSKKEEKNSNEGGNGKNSISNSNSGGGASSTGSHAKDNKEFFTTTVNLNVPNVIPNSSSSAFVKTTGTIKVPTAPSSSALATTAASSSGGNSGGSLHNVHSSTGSGSVDSSSSSSSSSNSRNLSSANSNSNSTSGGSNAGSPWVPASPSKGGGEKGRLSPSVNNTTTGDKTTGAGSYKKARAFAAAAAAAASASAAASSDKSGSGSSQDENSSGPHGSSSSGASSYRNPGALSINNSATDLSTTASNIIQGSQSQPGNGGIGSPKETGKGGRNNPSSSSSSSSTSSATQDVCVGTSVGTVTEPDCLGPCEPGTSVTLEGIVWHETESGVLVVNVTWRGKTYVGTLIDCTKNDWAPPRFCDSPTSDLEMRTPKNRGKRGRAQTATPVNEPVVADTRSANAKLRNGAKGRRGSNTATAFVAPASPVKPESWPKRKTRGSENESQEEGNPKSAKRPKVAKDGDRKDRRSNSPAADSEKAGPSSPQLIECPEPNCSKKYKHINGLRYHQSHAHTNNFVAAEDSDSNLSTASNTNASTAQDPPSSNSADNNVEPMVVDEIPDGNGNISQPGSVSDDSVTAPSTPSKKSSGSPPAAAIPSSKVDDKIYDLSSDADLNPGKDAKSPGQEGPEPYSSKGKAGNKSQIQNKDPITSDPDSKLSPENLSKDSSTTPPSVTNSPSMPTPTLTPRTPILTVPVVPYMSLQQSRNMAHGHVVNVPRVDNSHNSRDSENSSPMKNSGNHGVTSKNAPWQPHAQSGLSSHGSHGMNTSPPGASITVPLNIPMNIPEKIGGGSMKDKDKMGISDQPSSKKNKHKKKSKDKDKEREGKSKDKDKGDMGKGLNVPMPGGPSDYSRTSSLFHNSNLGSDSMRSKDMGSSDDNDSSRKNSLDNRDDPQSPAYSDISDANDSGPDAELSAPIKEGNCKGLVIPGAEIKKELIVPSGVPGAPPFQSFYNPSLQPPPYLDPLYSARQLKESSEGREPPVGESEETDSKGRPGLDQIKYPNITPTNAQVPSTSAAPGVGNVDGRRSPKMDFQSKFPYPNYFSYPYSSFQPYADHQPFLNAVPPQNSFNPHGPPGRMFPGMEEKDNSENNIGPGKGPGKPVDKDEGPGNVQIKQEPVDREERRGKDKPQTSAFAMNIDQDKNISIKSEFGSDHSHPKHLPSYMDNSSSKHLSKEHKRNSEDSRHERRHDVKDMDGKPDRDRDRDNIKSSRNSSSNSEKNKGASAEEPSEAKERKDEGAKPTMETTGPPPPPTASAYYLPQGYLPGNPFGIPFDPNHPLYRQMMVPNHYPGSPYMHPGQIPRFPSPGGPTPLPEDLSRPSPPGNPSKALDLLQHHAAQYYNSHKIHELQERALKSPSPQVSNQRGPIDRDGPGPVGAPPSSSPGHPLGGPGVSHPGVGGGRSSLGPGVSANSAMPKAADLSKDSKPTIGPGGSIIPGVPTSDNVRTPPPTQHHVHSHTHHHTHVGIGYPIIPSIPAVSPQYSPHYGVLASPSAAPSVIPSFPPQKPS